LICNAVKVRASEIEIQYKQGMFMKKLLILLVVATVALGALPVSAGQAANGKTPAVRHLKRANHRLHQKVKRLRQRLHAKGQHGKKAA